MYFRNCTLFRFPAEFAASIAAAVLPAELEAHRLRDCGPIEMSSRGFVSPYGRDAEELTHTVGDFTLIALGEQEKILPASVIGEFLADKIAEVQERENRRVGTLERKRLKEQVVSELLPRAFIRPRRTLAYIDHAQHWIVIDTSSRKTAEDFITALREAVGRLPATPMSPSESPRALMTDWLIHGKLPERLVFGSEFELRDPCEAGAIVRGARQDLESDEVREHLKSGKQVFRLGLMMDERVSFILDESLVVRKVSFGDAVLDEIPEEACESARTELDARFTLMTLELRRLLGLMAETFGIGEEPAMRLDPPPTPQSMRDQVAAGVDLGKKLTEGMRRKGFDVSVSVHSGRFDRVRELLSEQTGLPDNGRDWLRNGERGASSDLLCARMLGVRPDDCTDHPHDPSDFRRCQLLLEVVPEFGARIGEMADVSPNWAGLSVHWPEILAAMDAEAKGWRDRSFTGSAPETYAMMRRLLG